MDNNILFLIETELEKQNTRFDQTYNRNQLIQAAQAFICRSLGESGCINLWPADWTIHSLIKPMTQDEALIKAIAMLVAEYNRRNP